MEAQPPMTDSCNSLLFCLLPVFPFTKPPLLQESRLTGGGSPNLVVLVEWKVPVERFMGAANISIDFAHDCTLVLYKQLMETGFG